MTERAPAAEDKKRHKEGLALVVSLILVAVILGLDLVTPANLILPILYGVAVVTASFYHRRWYTWTLAVVLAVTTMATRYLSPPPDANRLAEFTTANRALAVAATLLTATLVELWTGAQADATRHADELEARNRELEAVNQEIATREEEITRQNEELQAQTEELERQSEELRITNEELTRREKMLEQLLELSRSLSSETMRVSTDTVLTRICEALVMLTQGSGSAIMLREGDLLRVRCHHGFGPKGPASETLPFDESFAALILSRLQPGYVENLAQRPDIKIPQPLEGEPFHSILAAPLQINGRLIGTVEIYTHGQRTWSSEQVALVESLAVQSSVSLESVELFDTVQQERRRFETVLRTLPVPILVAEDERCAHVRANPAAAALFGVAADANLSPLQAGADHRMTPQYFKDGLRVPAEMMPIVRAVLGRETIRAEEFELLLPSQARVSLLVAASPIQDAKGRVTGGVSAAVDVTALKTLQHELELRRREAEEASVRKTRFLAAISHDIRTPTNAINLTAELIKRAAANPAMAGEVPPMADELQKSAVSLGLLVHDLLDVARFDTGKVEFQESEFSLGSLIADECRQLLPLAQEKGLWIDCSGAERAIWVRGDRVKVGRVVSNLVGNAIKFTDHGGLRLTTFLDPNNQPTIRVTDTGVGIAPQHQARIFDEFTQLKNPERDRYKGTGLGLAICKRLTEAMGGTIGVQSTEGKGSTFTVTLPASSLLPRSEQRTAAAGTEVDRRRVLEGLRVLLVEDHATTRWATRQILAGEGAEVTEAGDGQSALRLLENSSFDALLLDMMLPDMDGKEVLRSLHSRPAMPVRAVLVLTGDFTPERAQAVRALGAHELVSKPIDVQLVINMLRRVQDGARGPG